MDTSPPVLTVIAHEMPCLSWTCRPCLPEEIPLPTVRLHYQCVSMHDLALLITASAAMLASISSLLGLFLSRRIHTLVNSNFSLQRQEIADLRSDLVNARKLLEGRRD